MKEKLGNYVFIKTGRLDANAANPDGDYPFFTCAVEPLAIATFSYDCECVLVAGNGDLNVKYYNGKFDAYQRTYIIESRDKAVLAVPYLYYFLMKYVEELRSQAIGGVIKYIKLGNLTDAPLPIPSLVEQEKIVKKLQTLTNLISKKKLQLQKLDQLTSSRFIEMFGDLAAPHCKWQKEMLIDSCPNSDDIKCGPFGTQLNKEEYRNSGVAVWEIPQINSGFMTSPTHYLTAEKASQLEAYSLIPGDIAMSRKGNVGKCAIFPAYFQPGIIHSDVLRIRLDQRRVSPVFMMYQLHISGAVQHQIELVSSGAIMAGINVTKLKKIYVHLPPLELQNEFAAFVEQLDKSKLADQAYGVAA